MFVSLRLEEKDVERALEAMRSGNDLANHPLCFFLSVLTRLQSPNVISGSTAVEVAVFGHFVKLITQRLTEIRQIHGLPPPDARPRNIMVGPDFQQNNHELEAWSLLYHRYVCVDHSFSVQDIALQVSQDERTPRRRHRLGLTRLTHLLVKTEQEVRRLDAQNKQRIMLPLSQVPTLVGVEGLLSRLRQLLFETQPVRPLVLYGPPGIGKTALALTLAHQLVDAGQLDDLVWINLSDRAVTPLALIHEIAGQLGLSVSDDSRPEQALRAYLFAHPVLLLLDGAEIWLSETVNAETVLRLTDAAHVVTTSRVRAADQIGCYQVLIPELTREQAFCWLDDIAIRETPPRADWPDCFPDLWRLAGGNPHALQLWFQSSRSLPLTSAVAQTEISALCHHIWRELLPDERRVLLLALFFSQGVMPFHVVSDLAGLTEDAASRVLRKLTDRALLVPVHEPGTLGYVSQPLTRTILFEYTHQSLPISLDISIQEFMHSVCQRRVAQLLAVPQPQAAVDMLKLANDLKLPVHEQWQFACDLSTQVAEAGLWVAWSQPLAVLLQYPLSAFQETCVRLHLGIASRWMGQLEVAQVHFDRALALSETDTVQMGDILVEQAVVFRYWVQWQPAYQLLQRALGIYRSFENAAGYERCVHELAQLALDMGDPSSALVWLSRLDRRSLRTWSITCQIYLALGEHDQALDAASQSLTLLPVTHPNRGRILATLGQIYTTTGDVDTAVEYLLLAVGLLDQMKDMIGYARACNNLAVAYLKQPAVQRRVSAAEIRRWLTQALRIQEHIGDEIGQAVTRQNLDWLDTTSTRSDISGEWPY